MKTLTTAAIRVLGALSQLLMTLVVTNTAGISEAGAFLFAFAVVTILATLSRMGSEISGLKNAALAEYKQDIQRLLYSRILTVFLGSATLFAFLAFGFSAVYRLGYFDPSALSSLAVMTLSVPAFSCLGLFGEVIKGMGKPNDGVSIANIITPISICVSVIITSLFIHVDAFALSILACCSAYFGMFFAWFRIKYLMRKMPSAEKPPTYSVFSDLIEIFTQSLNLTIISSTSIVMQWVGSVLLGIFSSPEDVAGFSVAVRMSIAVSIFHSAVTSIMAPKIALAWSANDERKTSDLIKKTCVMISAPSLAILLFLFIFASQVLKMFSAEFTSYSLHFRILLAGQALGSTISHCGVALAMMGFYAEARNTSLVAIIALLGLMAVLVPMMSTLGAAISMSVSIVLGHVAAMAYLVARAKIVPLPLSISELVNALTTSKGTEDA